MKKKKKRLVVSFELLSFGTKHGAAPLGPKHYRIGDARIYFYFQIASLCLFSSFFFLCVGGGVLIVAG